MIDLSFLTEAEQEEILKVLNRDAELKKVEDQRVRNLYDALDDENELKYKSGQWFYEAKSKRHRDKIHGADLVRASIRKRRPPRTLADLSRSYSEGTRKSWVNSVNKDIFIPPELSGLMEEEEFVPVKVENTQSSKRVSFLPPDSNKEVLKNGAVSPSKERRNPFNSMNLEEENFKKNVENQVPVNGTEGRENLYQDVLPYKVKYGIKLPYPETGEFSQVSTGSSNGSMTNGGQAPIPKPRTIPLKKTDSLDRTGSELKREDSAGSTGKPKGILKRRSSSSSTDSETIRMAQKYDPSKIGLPTPIIQMGKNVAAAESFDESPENSLDKLKQVRFSANVHQTPPSPVLEANSGKEIGEFGILEQSNSNIQSVNPVLATLKDPKSGKKSSSELNVQISGEGPTLNGILHSSNEYDGTLNGFNKDLNIKKDDLPLQEYQPELNLSLDTNTSSGPEPLYSEVNKTSGSLHSNPSEDMKPESESSKVSNLDSVDPKQGNEASHPILNALRRSSNKKLPSHVVEEVSSENSNQEKSAPQKANVEVTYEDVAIERSQFSSPEKIKRLSQSVPALLDETDGRDTDSASENSFQLGRHKKTPSSLTNLSGSSGMASLSSVSGSVMSVYSGDFGNVDIKGNIQFAIDYVDDLQEFHIFVAQCKDLAVADVKKQRSDPYVKTYLLPEKAKMGKRKTPVKKKTLNPVYNDVLRV
ncbi:hypothetical protein GDO86_004763 [Hymenochirus boettgeri]|uniref:Synaptotagmin-like protein 2 n=1 Tax=Hymenochirus boettgeri TaxID=247094 RepID=A0A8T2KBU6_9PIPI|nr:hypothetical protein GDO86_004763 [Hymenochirus boettgeri]